MEIVREPLTEQQIKENVAKNNGDLVVIIEVELFDLIGDLDDLNDLTEEIIIGDHGNMMSDIRYRVVGSVEGKLKSYYISGSVLLEIRCKITFNE